MQKRNENKGQIIRLKIDPFSWHRENFGHLGNGQRRGTHQTLNNHFGGGWRTIPLRHVALKNSNIWRFNP